MQPLTKRQREIMDYLQEFIQQHGYAPSLEEVGRRFGLSSLATVHKHLTNLQEKGFIRRSWNRSRSVELLPARVGQRAIELPMLGYVAAGYPIEAVASAETIAVPEDLVGKRDSYVLRVKGDSMIDEHIRDGDFVIVEDRKTADNGEMVIALIGGHEVTLKKFYRENGRIRLQPANPAMQPIFVDPASVQLQGVVVGVMRNTEMADAPAKQINFTIVPDEPGPAGKGVRTYANFCAIAHSPFDLTITFCDVQPLTAEDIRHAEATETVRAPIVARIAIPFTVVPGIINALTEHMRAMQASTTPESSPSISSWPGPDKGPLH